MVGYVRVSTEDQATNVVSLSAQRARIDAYAVAMGLVVTDVAVDNGVSAKTLCRPALAKVLEVGAAWFYLNSSRCKAKEAYSLNS